MANITRFEPFSDMDEWFGKFARPVFRMHEAEPQIRMDVKEVNGGYLVKAEIPGVKKEDILVDVDGSQVSIRAEIRKEQEEKEGERVIRRERSYGMASRTFSLDNEVDQSGVKAKYADGVLEISLPKKAGAAARKITIS